jgi:hypothetical protein
VLYVGRHPDRQTNPKLIFRFGLLYSGFAPDYWWYELILYCRKLSIILIVTFASSNDQQLHLALGTLIVLLYVQEYTMPFENPKGTPAEKLINKKLHRIESCSLLVLISMVWSAVYFVIGCDDNDGVVCSLHGVVVLGGNVVFLILCSAIFLKALEKKHHVVDKLTKLTNSFRVNSTSVIDVNGNTVANEANANTNGWSAKEEGGVEMVGFENPMQKKGTKKEVKRGNSAKKNKSKFPEHLIVTGEEKSEKREMKETKETKETKEKKEPTITKRTSFRYPTSGKLYHHNEETGKTEWLTGIKIPKGFRAGQNMSVTTSLLGGTINIIIPQGYSEGDTMHVTDTGLVYDEPLYRGQLIKDAQKLQTEEKNSLSLQAVADAADKSAAVVCHAVAMYDFDGSNSNGRNISFKAGAIIEVNEMGE